jgi:hypothetical protein
MEDESAATPRQRDYRRLAVEAEVRAEAATDPQLRAAWGVCAASWRHLAEQAARMRHVMSR